ncbi:hypothetical protein CVIRNUC_010078 [Coccomyxa viridis]|uniref:Tubulin-tyrosine ligase n=1 Tax=Coccomyxa viridis TaxID=1274662 RepID=A0AAV1IIC4_9CHLO|nr:hypothetical protein CVIRNUC_010078 [Coccomyxa viridis]
MWWDERPLVEAHSHQDAIGPRRSKNVECLKIYVDLDCPYVRSVVVQALELQPGWTIILRDDSQAGFSNGLSADCIAPPEAAACHLVWAEYERIDWERIYAGEQHASSYCIRKGLIRKAHLAHNLKKWAAKHPDGILAGAVPETHVMEVDDVDYIDEALADVYEVRDMADGSATWIAKPSITNQAIGICIFDRVSTLRAALEAAEDMREWVVQRYIERPLLVSGRKFHIRAYVLCVGSLSVYAFSEALALFAGEPYKGASLEATSAHLTNTCRLQRSAEANGNVDHSVDAEQSLMLLSELAQELHEEGMAMSEASERVSKLTHKMHAVLGESPHRSTCTDLPSGECLEAVSAELSFFTLPNCFELFGFDLLVDEDWHLWLLEANAEPDLAQTGTRLRPVVADLVEGILQLVLPAIEGGITFNQVRTFASGVLLLVTCGL